MPLPSRTVPPRLWSCPALALPQETQKDASRTAKARGQPTRMLLLVAIRSASVNILAKFLSQGNNATSIRSIQWNFSGIPPWFSSQFRNISKFCLSPKSVFRYTKSPFEKSSRIRTPVLTATFQKRRPHNSTMILSGHAPIVRNSLADSFVKTRIGQRLREPDARHAVPRRHRVTTTVSAMEHRTK